MSDILRPAQSNINFATIFEMRKTNQLLVAGFSDLSKAINGINYAMSSQLASLKNELSNQTDILIENSATDNSSSNDVNKSILRELEDIRLFGVG